MGKFEIKVTERREEWGPGNRFVSSNSGTDTPEEAKKRKRFSVQETEREQEWSSKENEVLASNSVADTPEQSGEPKERPEEPLSPLDEKPPKRFDVKEADRDSEWAAKNPPVSSNSNCDTPEAYEPDREDEPLSPLDER